MLIHKYRARLSPRVIPGPSQFAGTVSSRTDTAVSGNLDELTDPEDTRVMLQSAMTALEALVNMGADCPQMGSFRERFIDVTNQKPQKLFRQKLTQEIPFRESSATTDE